jgi:hypothetical protein
VRAVDDSRVSSQNKIGSLRRAGQELLAGCLRVSKFGEPYPSLGDRELDVIDLSVPSAANELDQLGAIAR